MTAKNKKRLRNVALYLLVGGGAYLAYEKLKPKKETIQPVKYLPTPGPAPKPTKPITTGATVKMKADSQGYTGSGMSTPYEEGGSDGSGTITKGSYAGVVIAIDKTYNSAKVRNFTFPMMAGTTAYYEFWLPIETLTT